MNQCICIISSRSMLQSKFHSLQYYRYTSTVCTSTVHKRELKQCCYESIKIGDSSQWIGTRGGGSKVYRRSSGAKGNHLAETAGVWKSAAIRQTSLAPADYLKPPLCTPTPTPTISFPKSVARIIKLVEESFGGLLPSPPILVRQPPSSASLCPASFTYAPLRPSDSISLLFSLPLSPPPLSLSLYFPVLSTVSPSRLRSRCFSFFDIYLCLYISHSNWLHTPALSFRLALFHRACSFCSHFELSNARKIGRRFVSDCRSRVTSGSEIC